MAAEETETEGEGESEERSRLGRAAEFVLDAVELLLDLF